MVISKFSQSRTQGLFLFGSEFMSELPIDPRYNRAHAIQPFDRREPAQFRLHRLRSGVEPVAIGVEGFQQNSAVLSIEDLSLQVVGPPLIFAREIFKSLQTACQ